jgi:hypothetical protein
MSDDRAAASRALALRLHRKMLRAGFYAQLLSPLRWECDTERKLST